MDTVALRFASDRNVEHALRHFAIYGDGGVLAETSATLMVASATTHVGAFHNAAMRLSPKADPRVVLTEMSAFADARDRDITVWVSEHDGHDLVQAARSAGFGLRSTAVGMAINTPPDHGSATPGVELRRVTDAVGVAAFVDVHRQNHADVDQSDAAIAHFASKSALLAPNVSAFVAHLDGLPVSCAMVVHGDAEAGVYWVATTPGARRRGLGDTVTRVATRAGFEHGAEVVVLQATQLGHSVYRRIGFAPFTQYHRYIRVRRAGRTSS